MGLTTVEGLFREHRGYIQTLAAEQAEMNRLRTFFRDYTLVRDLEAEARIAIWWLALSNGAPLTTARIRGAVAERMAGFVRHSNRKPPEEQLTARHEEQLWGTPDPWNAD